MANFDTNKPSQGLGDTVAKITHALGLDIVATKIANLLGEEDCGCDGRREALNNLVPYTGTVETDYVFAKPRVYEVLNTITKQVDGVTTVYKIGEKVLIDSIHPLYTGLEIYVTKNYLKRDAT